MQIKKFEAPTMNEALAIVKQELGPDAIILSTKNHRRGLGLLSKSSIEVTAAVSERNLSKKKITEKLVRPDVREEIKGLPAGKQKDVFDRFASHYESRAKKEDRKEKAGTRYVDIKDDDQQEMVDLLAKGIQDQLGDQDRSKAASGYARNSVQQSYEPAAQANSAAERVVSIEGLQSELNLLKRLMEEMQGERRAQRDMKAIEQEDAAIQAYVQVLLANGVDRKYASRLVRDLSLSVPRTQHQDQTAVLDALAVEMLNSIRVYDLIRDLSEKRQKRMIGFLGPSGSGKTSMLMKVALKMMREKNQKVGILHYSRAKGAQDLTAALSRMFSIPYRRVETAEELDRALHEFQSLETVLVDTSGVSTATAEQVSDMGKLFQNATGPDYPLEWILTLPVHTRELELYRQADAAMSLNIIGLAMTFLDEAVVYGNLYNLPVRTGLPLCFFSVGTKTPEDLELATKERVVGLVLDV